MQTGTSSQNSQLLHKTSQKFTRPARQPWRSFFSIAGCVYGKKFCRSFSRCLFPALWEVWFLYKTFFVDENILVFRRWRCLWVCILVGLREKKKKSACSHTVSRSRAILQDFTIFEKEQSKLGITSWVCVQVFFPNVMHLPTNPALYPPTHMPASSIRSRTFYLIMILSVLTFEEILDLTNMHNWRLCVEDEALT